jgi:hypothetical protein
MPMVAAPMHKRSAGMNPDVLSRKTSRIAFAILAMVSCAALSGPAAAQWERPYEDGPGLEAPDDGDAMVPPQRVMRWVARQGYTDLTRPRLNGSVYVLDGTGSDGTRMRFTVDAYDGELISSRPLGRVAGAVPEPGLRPPGLIPRGGAPEFGEAPLPPGVIQRRGGPEYEEGALMPPGVMPRRGGPEYDDGALMPPRGGPPEYGEAAPRGVRPPLAGAPLPGPRQAMRDDPPVSAPPIASAGPAPSGVYGLNPGAKPEGAARPAPKPRATAAAPAPKAPAAPRAAPAAPSPSTAKPAAAPQAEASAGAPPRGPVRVIEGVTPVLPKTEGSSDVRIPEPPPVTPPVTIQ